MKKIYLFFALILITASGFITAQEQDNSKSSLLWEITGKNLDKPSYLFGTMHMIPKEDFFMTKLIADKARECEVMTFEVNMFGLSFSEKIDMVQYLLLEDKTLKDLMNSDDYNRLKRFAVDSLGIREKKFEKRYIKFTPFGLNSMFMKMYMGKVKMYEKELYKIARKNKREITELETIDFQLKLVTDIPLESQIKYFLDTDNFHESKALIKPYKLQDLDMLYSLTNSSDSEDEDVKAFTDKFLNERNMNWLPIIISQISDKSSFIAVGALHLPGKKGIIELLREKGYTVKPII